MKAFTFFNSGFGLWLLSSVFLGGLAWSYSHWTESNELIKNREAEARRLVVEITGRLDYFHALGAAAKNDLELWRVAGQLDRPEGLINIGVYPNYAGIGMNALLWQLKVLLSPQKDKDKNIDWAIKNIRNVNLERVKNLEVLGDPSAELRLDHEEQKRVLEAADNAFSASEKIKTDLFPSL